MERQICDFKSANLRFLGKNADFKSANLRFFGKNADSQICRLVGGYKSANLRFLEETQIRRFAD